VQEDFIEHIIEAHVMAYGFGSFERLLYNLRFFEVTAEELHKYLHQATGLSSLWGLEFLHLSVKDLARYVRSCRQRVNEAEVFPRDMKLYTPPQIIFGKALGHSDEEIKSKMSQVYRERFCLSKNEIGLAWGFFSNYCLNEDASFPRKRLTLDYSQQVSVNRLTEYRYPNGHRGVYPLDTNYAGMLVKSFGYYQIESNSIRMSKESKPHYGDYKFTADESKVNMCDKDFLKRKESWTKQILHLEEQEETAH